jgi:adenylate cyclase
MATEIERKFIVNSDEWRGLSRSAKRFRQGYICVSSPGIVAEVRIRQTIDRAFIAVKGAGGLTRSEFEYEIPHADADVMLKQFCPNRLLEKTRHIVEFGNATWEVDEFSGTHYGLILAEVELDSETQQVQLPPWVGAEVTHDPRFKNAYLAVNPQSWRDL